MDELQRAVGLDADQPRGLVRPGRLAAELLVVSLAP